MRLQYYNTSVLTGDVQLW